MMLKLTKNDLENFLENQRLALPDSAAISLLYGLSAEILIHLIGGEWVVNNVFGRKPLDKFLRANPESKEDRFKMTDRLMETAELLFNFQDISGVENLVERIKKDSIEACVAELQSAKLLYFNDTPFYFNSPSNQKGLDYNVVATTQGFEIPCEIKCKIESTNFSENTIKATLKHARTQLPENTPSIIFIKIPETWTVEDETEEKLLGVLNEFFNGTTRVNSVIYHWEEWDYLQTGQALRTIRFNEIANPNSKVKLERILKKPEINQSPANWTYFNDLILNKFGKSDLTRPKPVKAIVLGNGFSWHSVLRILPQISKGQHVLYDMGIVGGTRMSFLIDENDSVKFQIIDDNSNRFELKTNEPFFSIGLDSFSYLRFQLTPILNYSELSIAVNNKVVGKKTVPLNQSSVLFPHNSLGADLESNRKTAFEYAEHITYEKSSVEINDEITEYFKFKFALEIPN